MARKEERRKAIELRLQGKTYSEIRSKFNIPKSTLSNWLTKYPLTTEQLQRVGNKRFLQIERYRQTRARQREERTRRIYHEEQQYWLPLSERELMLAGLLLYWGEGSKATRSHISVSNTDPRVITFAYYWMRNCLKIRPQKIRVLLHLYSDMNINKERRYWQRILHVPESNFSKPYIKMSTRAGLTQKGFGHGTCNLIACRVSLKEEIMQSLAAISDYYSRLI